MELFAVIFDLDGTIINSEKAYSGIFKQILRDLGKEANTNRPQMGGLGIEENWKILLKKYKIKTSRSLKDLSCETTNMFIKLIPTVKVKDGFIDLVRGLKKDFIKIALGTSTDKGIVEEVFKIIKIEKYFDVVVAGDMVKHKKPAPDIFLLAAKKLRLDPEKCVVIEDSEAGVKAAKVAGMKVIAVSTNTNRKFKGLADLIVSSFRQLTPEKIFELQSLQ